jgi:hypothetical protein
MHTIENPGGRVVEIFVVQTPGGQCFLDKILTQFWVLLNYYDHLLGGRGGGAGEPT